MSAPCPFLFVYGTLRTGAPHPIARFLADNARYLGHARTRGRLYDLGVYPGMLPAAEDDDWVRGDLYEMLNPHSVLDELDKYEGCVADHPQPWVFSRSLALVCRNAAVETEAWVYWFTSPIAEARRILSGDYTES